jgi:shikimate dehydrogenase
VVANRTPERAASLLRLAAQFDNGRVAEACSLDDLARQPFDLVINATSAGLAPATAAAQATSAAASASLPAASAMSAPPERSATPVAPWTNVCFADGALAYDLSYADQATAFMRWSSQHGAARAADGLGMLLEQAAESFLLWRGVRPDTRDVAAMLRPGTPLDPMAAPSRIRG